MSDAALHALAREAALASRWRDAFGRDHEVSVETLRAVLNALGLPAGSAAQIAESRASLAVLTGDTPPLLTARAEKDVAIGAPGARYTLTLEDGRRTEGRTDARGMVAAPADAGYHRLEIDRRDSVLAVAPRSTPVSANTARVWGLAAQLYSLRRPGDGGAAGIGDFAALRDLVTSAARHGAAAVAISPVHAQFSADPDRFSPYAPSSRLMLNVAHIPCDLPDLPAPEGADTLADWPAMVRARLHALRARFDRGSPGPDFEAWRAEQGEALERHARFEALHASLFGADLRHWHWRTWPEGLRSPDSPDVAAFAAANATEVTYHAWLQYEADRALAAAQHAGRAAGMPIGLISDLAVGTDSGGSHAWSRQDETLVGLSIGAPPDLLSPQGQDWGLVAFSPTGLRRNGYGALIEMLRAALRHAGGVRVDHVMGLARLWVLPEGAAATEGTYLHFPQADMLRLVALEAHRHDAVLIGEDLGTLPDGFQATLNDAGVAGLRVLWFERDGEERFKPPRAWTPGAVAMTSTHDLPTIAGWWSGRDLEWRGRLGLLGDDAAAQARDERDRDRRWLWDAMRASGAAERVEPPAPWDVWPVVRAACAHVGRSACGMVLLPLEDALALPEQPNLPGTLHEHPNWRRRLPGEAATLLDNPDVTERLTALAASRGVVPG